MKRTMACLVMFTLVFSAMAILTSTNAAAANTTIAAGDTYSYSLTVSADSSISYYWSAEHTLQFVLHDQANNILKSYTGLLSFDDISVDSGGLYTCEWTNPNSEAVNLTYTVEESDISPGFLDDLGDAIVLGLMIVLAVIVIIVVVVVLVVAKGKKKQPQALTGPGAGVVPPMGNNCAVCGSPLDQSMAFCAKCGAKLR